MTKKAFDNLSDERKQDIIHKTMELYTSHAYEDITLRMLTEKLEVNPATFYRYFDEKDDLFIYVYYLVEKKSISDESAVLFRFQKYEGHISELERKFLISSNFVPERVVQRIVFSEYKNDSLELYKKELRKQRYADNLRNDVDEDLIAYMYSTIGYNLNLYFKENKIEERELQMKMKEYLFYSFFQKGIFK